MNWAGYITVDSQVYHGKACIKGTRGTLSVILHNLADGQSIDQILANYPALVPEVVRAVIVRPAALFRQRTPGLSAWPDD